jgi:hypothetical protein
MGKYMAIKITPTIPATKKMKIGLNKDVII